VNGYIKRLAVRCAAELFSSPPYKESQEILLSRIAQRSSSVEIIAKYIAEAVRDGNPSDIED